MTYYTPPGSMMRMLGAQLVAAGAPTTDPGANQRALARGLGNLESMSMNQRRFQMQERARRDAAAIHARRMNLLEKQANRQQSSTKKTYPNAPPAGTVKQGYEYIGGDPSSQASWKKVK